MPRLDRDPPAAARRAAGFTLIEVMAAVVIVSLVLVTVLVVRTRNVNDAVESSRARQAAILAETIMGDALIGMEPQFEEGELPTDFRYDIQSQLETIGQDRDVVMITVTVIYPARDDEETIVLTSYRNPFEGEEFEEDLP